jgi:hypothetical protein
MNEKIKSLIEKAEHQAKKQSGYEDWEVYVLPDSQVVFEKFAELIVRDCTRIIANQAWESRTAGANGDWTEFNALSRVAGQVKEHFGIKE